MSFKREGNDGSLLGVLKKRRIKDLLAEDIPEEEAKLLSNGRFACLVCGNNPIFDTVSMLSLHRHGKRHKHYEEIFYARKQELRSLVRKRQQEDILKYGKTSISTQSESMPALGQSPYNPCVKKGRAKAGDRKQCVDLSGKSESTQKLGTSTDLTSSRWRDICEQQSSGPVMHEKQLKNVFKMKGTSALDVRITPYQRSRTVGSQRISSIGTSASSGGQFKAENSRLEAQSLPHPSLQQCSAVGSYSSRFSVSERLPVGAEHPDLPVNSLPQPVTQGPQPQSSQARDYNDKDATQRSQTPAKSQPKPDGPDKDMAAKYRLLQGSGWKKDWDGKWIRDEDAEFDSDEEPPDLP